MQQDGQLKMQELQLQDQIKQRELASAQQVQASNDQRDAARTAMDAQLKREQMQIDAQFRQHEAAVKQQTEIQLANIKASNALEIARVGAAIEDGKAVLQRELKDAGQSDAAAMLDQIKQLHAAVTAPAEVVRDPVTGKVTGVKRGNTTQTVQRDAQGRVSGVH